MPLCKFHCPARTLTFKGQRHVNIVSRGIAHFAENVHIAHNVIAVDANVKELQRHLVTKGGADWSAA